MLVKMIDGGDRDEKILCVPDKDPRYSKVRSLQDLAPHRLNEIAEFSDLQNLEQKITEIRGWQDVDQVMPLVEKCIKAGSEKVGILTRSYLMSAGMNYYTSLKLQCARSF